MKKDWLYNILAIIAFAAFLIVGLKNIDLYGVSFDENIDRYKTLVNIAEINTTLGNPLNINKNPQGFENGETYPNAFQIFQAVCLGLEYVFDIKDLGCAFRMRHYIVFMLFWISTVCFYFLLRNRVTHLLLPLFFTGLLILQPRIYAHCHYNPKDIVFVSLLIFMLITQYFFLKKPRWWVLFWLSLLTALAINRRLVGLLFPLVFTIVSWVYFNKDWKNLKKVFAYIPLSLILLVAMWPTIWDNPFGDIMNLIFINSRLPIESFTWLNGTFYATNNLPWYYLFYWVGITTPVPSLNILMVGQILFWVIVWKHPTHTFYRAFDYYIVICLWIIISMVLIQHPTLYNGWRHFFFIYPLIIYLACVGWQPRYYKRKLLVLGALCFSFMFNMGIMINMNAYHNAYVSVLAGNDAGFEKFPMDYSGVSYIQLFENIEQEDKRDTIKIFGYTPLQHNLALLSCQRNHPFVIVNNIEDADYYLTHYPWHFVKDKTYHSFQHLHAINVYRQKRIISTAFKLQ